MRVMAMICLTLALASCGIDSQPRAQVFEPSEVPFGLDNTASSTTIAAQPIPNATTATPTSTMFDIYFIRSGILVAVTRQAPGPLSSDDLVDVLVSGPTPSEVTSGHRSALTSPEIVTHTRDNGSIVTVDLAKNFNEIPRSDRIFALAQITLTLTGRAGVTLVQYTIADTPIEVPKANGIVTREPVSRADYSSLLQNPASTPLPTTTSSSIGPSPTTRGETPTSSTTGN